MLKGGSTNIAKRKLNEYDTFIRSNEALSIVKKAQLLHERMLSSQISSRRPFGLESNTAFDEDGDIILRSSKGTGKIRHEKITSGSEILNKWKVIVSKVSFEHAGVPDKDGMMRVLSVIQILEPNSACTESYLVAGAFETEKECKNLVSYLHTKFARFLIMQMLASMNMTKASYSFVPMQDFSKPWTDEELYAKYGITEEEIAFIDSMIRPMDLNGGSDDE